MKGKQKIVALTAYSAPMARLLDSHCDVLLVGDSLGMVVYGMPDTLGVTLEMMARHGNAVAQHSSRALIAVDMPFGTYQQSPQQAFSSAVTLLQRSHCQAVKLEGGEEMAETAAFLVRRGIPVMAHIGLKPQHVHQMGGYRYQGRNDEAAKQLMAEARALEQAGAFAIVLEGICEPVAAEITRACTIPTIGIGASPHCDGQILVIDDLLGLTPQPPRFAKPYAQLDQQISEAVKRYAEEVQSGEFPQAAHCFGPGKN